MISLRNSKVSSLGLEGWLSRQNHWLSEDLSSIPQWATHNCLCLWLQGHPASLVYTHRLSSLPHPLGSKYRMTNVLHSHCTSSRIKVEAGSMRVHGLYASYRDRESTGGPGIRGSLKLQLFLSASSLLPVSFLLLLLKYTLIDSLIVLFPEWLSVALN